LRLSLRPMASYAMTGLALAVIAVPFIRGTAPSRIPQALTALHFAVRAAPDTSPAGDTTPLEPARSIRGAASSANSRIVPVVASALRPSLPWGTKLYSFRNCLIGTAGGLDAFAGGSVADSRTGIIVLWRPGTGFWQWYATPVRTGAIWLIGATDRRLTLRSSEGATWTFDLASRRFSLASPRSP
jgi:hypothetical protein